ncbi:MAG: membrane protein insertion efficiency factor YidD [Clostridia bacterium]|nr:membrane protein insertion efficiency factor YidD [Clostridia bacterium]
MNKLKGIVKFIINIPKNIEILLIRLYQKLISPMFGEHRCIFYPTCSEYTRQAVDKYGIIKGNILGIKRILKCNPFSKGGVDYLK